MGCAGSAPIQAYEAASFDECYDLGEQIGAGAFAQVHSCVHRRTLNTAAVKIFKTSSAKDRHAAARELKVWKQVGAHANVAGLLNSYVETGPDALARSTYFIMQHCKCSVMDMYNLNTNSFCNDNILDVFHQVFLGLQHCHSMNVVHRDMKATNLLVDFDGVVKLADFGLSLIIPEGGVGVTGVVGSTPYMSPEMVQGRTYGFGTDVWSCAAVIYFLVYGQYPYDAARGMKGDERKKGMTEAIKTDMPRPKYEPAIGAQQPAPQLQELIQTLLQRDVEKRPDAHRSAKLVLTAKNGLVSTGCTSSPKVHQEVEFSTESTRDSDAVPFETYKFPISSGAVSSHSFPVSSSFV